MLNSCPHGLDPVSYTHLDVYKRQVYHGDDDHVDFLNQVYALTSQTNPLHADVWPVSYTHLDVYKRQPLNGASRKA